MFRVVETIEHTSIEPQVTELVIDVDEIKDIADLYAWLEDTYGAPCGLGKKSNVWQLTSWIEHKTYIGIDSKTGHIDKLTASTNIRLSTGYCSRPAEMQCRCVLACETTVAVQFKLMWC